MRFPVLAVAFVFSALVMGQEPIQLASLRDQWQGANQRDARPVQESYFTALEKLRDELTKERRIEDAKVAQEEIRVLTKVNPPSPKHTEARDAVAGLKSLRIIYDREIAELERKNLAKYNAALEKLLQSFADEAELESVVAVQEELGRIRAGNAGGNPTNVPLFWKMKSAEDYEAGGNAVIKEVAGKLRIKATHEDGPTNMITSRRKFKPPFKIVARAATDSTNLRMYWGDGVVIFNWELRPGELRMTDPQNPGRKVGFNGAGQISTREIQAIEIEVTETMVIASVNGEERGAIRGDYAGLEAPIGIGPAHGSTITIESLEVHPVEEK